MTISGRPYHEVVESFEVHTFASSEPIRVTSSRLETGAVTSERLFSTSEDVLAVPPPLEVIPPSWDPLGAAPLLWTVLPDLPEPERPVMGYAGVLTLVVCGVLGSGIALVFGLEAISSLLLLGPLALAWWCSFAPGESSSSDG